MKKLLFPFFLSPFLLFSLFSFFVQTVTAQETPINRFLKIELGEDDYEILNLVDGVQYAIRTETDENNKLVIRVYDENNQAIAEYPGHAVVYPQFDDEAVLGPHTIIVSQETNDADLINLEDDLIVFRISDSTRNYKVGDILFGGISHESPYGYLRLLISQTENDTLMIFQTEIPSLLDAFDALSVHRVFDYETLMDEETGKTRFEQVGVNGIRTRGITNLGELFISAEKSFLDSLLTIEIGLKGTIQVEFVFKAKKFLGIPYAVDECKLVGHFGLDANMAFKNAAVTFDATITLQEKKFPNITIPILGVPLVLTNKLFAKVKLHVEGGVKVKNNIFGKITTKTGVHYKNGLKGVMDFTPKFGYSPPEVIGVYGNVGVSVGLELEVNPYSIKALTGYLSFYYGPEATFQTMDPQYEIVLKGKLAAGLKYDFGKFLGFKIQGGWEIPIWEIPPLTIAKGNFITKEPSVATLPAYNITTTQATLKGEVTKKGISDVFERGFQWGLNTNALINNTKVGSGLGIFERQITDLQENKTYFYRAYAENYDGRTDGNIITISIPMLEPYIDEPYNVCTNYATVNASFYRGTNSGATIPDEYGFVWTTNSFPPVSELDAYPNKMSVPVKLDSYSETIEGLSPNTQYYVASYIKYLGKTKISSSETIHTLENESQCVKLTISNPTNVTPTSATFHVTVFGEPAIIDKGICYSSENMKPTMEDLKISHGSDVGDFTAILDNLQEATPYYVRPYAKTDERIFYGEVKEKTACDSGYHYLSYRNENGTLLYTCVNRITTPPLQPLTSGWYSLSSGLPYTVIGPIIIEGDVHLILEDGCNLEIESGILVNSGNSLTIYAQNEGTGELTATGSNGSSSSGGTAGIGGGSNINDRNGGVITINGGLIKANGGDGNGIYGAGAGIGGGGAGINSIIFAGNGGTIIINGGTIIARGGNASSTTYSYINSGGGGAGIGGGGGVNSGGGIITINGGIVSANGGNASNGGNNYSALGCAGGLGGSGGGSGIGGGGGSGGASGDPNFSIYNPICGGGGSSGGGGGTITITGGTINAIGGERGNSGGSNLVTGGGGGRGSNIGGGGGGGGGGSGLPVGCVPIPFLTECGASGSNGNTNSSNIGIGATGGKGGDSYQCVGGAGGSGGDGGTIFINGGTVNGITY